MSGYWNEFLATGIDELDSTCKNFFDGVTDYTKALTDEEYDESARKFLDVVEKFVRLHFVAEEKLFISINFHEISIHQAQHDYFRAKFQEMYDRVKYRKVTPEITAEIHQHILDWLVRHITTSDVNWIRTMKYGADSHAVLRGGADLCPNCGAAVKGGKYCGKCGYQLAVPRCHQCGEIVGDGDKFCTNCGASLVPKKCPRCGIENKPDAAFCIKCGSQIS